MRPVELLQDLARRPLDAAEALREKLTPELLNAHPHHDNSAAWLLWHAAREIDAQVADLSGEAPVWTAQGFDRKFAIDLPDPGNGYGHSAREARSIVCDDADLLLDHLRAAVEAQLAYLEKLENTALGEVIDDSWDPPVTRASRLISVSADALEHVGQAAYVAGMSQGAFE
ncbi:mycothiol transferase [Leucobacter sp. USHLN153]|uniref:mycothiol transferase n=1 Tax=Leucobacter sp. USHLN153 TaxID=3081268 RepID=UPI0030164ED4